METGSDNGNDWRPELAAVSGAVPCEPEQPRVDACGRARADLSVRLHFPMVAVVGASFCDSVNRRRRPKRHETMREPMERRQGGGNDRRPELASVSCAMPYAPRLRRRALGPGPSARLPVRLPVSLVAAVGSSFCAGRAPLLREQANTRPNSERGRGARRTPSFGPTRRPASITSREPAITGTPATARICARLTRAPRVIALPGTASARSRLLLSRDVVGPDRRLAGLSSVWRWRRESSDRRSSIGLGVCRAAMERRRSPRRRVTQLTLRHLHFMSSSSHCDRKTGKLVLVNEIVAGWSCRLAPARELAPASDKWNLRCTHFPKRIGARINPTASIISSIQTSFCVTRAARRARPTSISIGS